MPSAARRAFDQTNFVAVHTLESHKFGCEVVPKDGLLGTVADGAWKQSVATARLTGIASVHTLKNGRSTIVLIKF